MGGERVDRSLNKSEKTCGEEGGKGGHADGREGLVWMVYIVNRRLPAVGEGASIKEKETIKVG